MAYRVLLADDSLTIQKVVELTFSEANYDLMTVGNGLKAVEALGTFDPELVLADVVMPGRSGYEVCEASKARDPRVPVVLLTGTFEPFDRARAERAGCDHIVTKPFDSQQLAKLVADLLARAEEARLAPVVEERAPEPPPEKDLSKSLSEMGDITAFVSAVSLRETLAGTPEPAAPVAPAPARATVAVPSLDLSGDMYATTALRIPTPAELDEMERRRSLEERAAAAPAREEATIQPGEPFGYLPLAPVQDEEATVQLVMPAPVSAPSQEEVTVRLERPTPGPMGDDEPTLRLARPEPRPEAPKQETVLEESEVSMEPEEPEVEPVIEAIAEPVGQAPVEPGEPVVEAAIEPVPAVESVVEAVAPVVETVESGVEAVAPVVETVEPVVEAVEPNVEAVEPVVETVEPMAETTAEAVPEPPAPVEPEAPAEPEAPGPAPLAEAGHSLDIPELAAFTAAEPAVAPVPDVVALEEPAPEPLAAPQPVEKVVEIEIEPEQMQTPEPEPEPEPEPMITEEFAVVTAMEPPPVAEEPVAETPAPAAQVGQAPDEDEGYEPLVPRDIEEDIASFEESGLPQVRPDIWEQIEANERAAAAELAAAELDAAELAAADAAALATASAPAYEVSANIESLEAEASRVPIEELIAPARHEDAITEPAFYPPQLGELAPVEAAEDEPVPAEPQRAVAAGPTAVSAVVPEPPEPPLLRDEDVDRIARRVLELLADKIERVALGVAWDVVPEMAERLVKERIRELENA